MPGQVIRTISFHDKEILKWGTSLDGVVVKPIVLDSTAITMSADPNQATYVDAGVILTKAAGGKKMVPFTGAGKIEGILARPVPILVNTTAGQESGAMYYRDVVFATASIVGFTQYQAALMAATSGLQNCGWE